MPLYDYGCDACGAEMELQHKIGVAKRKCPKCGKSKLRRLWNRVAAFHSRLSPMHQRAGRGRG